MKLPNGDVCIVEIAKIRDYCLSPIHPRGRHKARVFKSALGMTVDHVDELREALIAAARDGNAIPGISDEYGTRYIMDFELRRGERVATIRSSWIVQSGETEPRFVTCFVL